MKFEFSQQIKKNSNIKSHKNLSSGSLTVPCGQMGGHDKTNSPFSQFCEHT